MWGEHAMEGTEAAQVIPELAPAEGDLVVPKRAYSAFGDTGLLDELRRRGVEEVVLTGQHTHCCVRHSAYDAFQGGLRVVVPADAVAVFEGVDADDALEYLRTVYGTQITTTDALVEPAPIAA